MLRLLIFMAPLAVMLWVFSLIDCLQTPERHCRHLPKPAWLMLVGFLPVAGGVAWLLLGKPRSQRRWSASASGSSSASAASVSSRPSPSPPSRPLAPDDDPQFLAQLRQNTQDHEKMLAKWEDNLRQREQALRTDVNEQTSSELPASVRSDSDEAGRRKSERKKDNNRNEGKEKSSGSPSSHDASATEESDRKTTD